MNKNFMRLRAIQWLQKTERIKFSRMWRGCRFSGERHAHRIIFCVAKLLILALALLCALALTGCQLAIGDDAVSDEGRLIGVIVTKEYLDLFDFEAYFNDNAAKLMAGGAHEIEDGAGYEGRLYAELVARPVTNDETGEVSETYEYAFTGIDGQPFFVTETNTPDGSHYIASTSGPAIADAHISVGDTTAIECAVYATPGRHGALYINPVYQQADGRVYALAGSGYSFSGDSGEGSVFTSTFEENHTVTASDGEEKKQSFRAEVRIAFKYPSEDVRVIEMGGDNTPVSSTALIDGALPESLVLGEGTAYVILETRAQGTDGENVTRKLAEAGERYIEYFSLREDGLFEVRQISLLWETAAE